MGLPEPDLVLYLDMPTEVTEKMLRHREEATATAADIHEQTGTTSAAAGRAPARSPGT